LHLAACAAGHPLTTHLQGQDGRLTLPPLGRDAARENLDRIGHAWHQALCEPLPIACATAFAWLKGEEKDNGEYEARKAFESGFMHTGEQEKEPALARAARSNTGPDSSMPRSTHTPNGTNRGIRHER